MDIIKKQLHQKWNRVTSFGIHTSWKWPDIFEKLLEIAHREFIERLLQKSGQRPKLSKLSNESQKVALYICNLFYKTHVIQGPREKLGWTWL